MPVFGAEAEAFAERQRIIEELELKIATGQREIRESNEILFTDIVLREEKRREEIRALHADRTISLASTTTQAVISNTFGVLEQRQAENLQFEQEVLNARAEITAAQNALVNSRTEQERTLALESRRGAEIRIRQLEAERAAGASILADITKGILKQLGTALVGQGISDLAKGVSRALGTYGLDPTAAALIAWGSGEIGSGIAMQAGALIVPSGGAVAPVPGAVGLPGGDLSGGGTGDFAGAGRDIDDDDNGGLTIIVQGSLSNEETIVLLRRAMAESDNQGF